MKTENTSRPRLPTYCKDVKAIASAWGIRLFEQRNKQLKQLAALRAVMGREDFPQKVKGVGFWRRDEVVAFGKAWIKVKRDRRGFTVVAGEVGSKTSNVQHRTSNIEVLAHGAKGAMAATQVALPKQSAPADGELFDTGTAQFENTLDNWEDKLANPNKWLMSPLQLWQLKQLQQNRPHLFKESNQGGSAAPPYQDGVEIYGGVEGVAEAINKEFPGANVHKVYVSDWLKGKRFPCNKAGVPPMPPPHASGRWKRSLVFAWYRQYVKAELPTGEMPLQGSLDNRSRMEKANADLAEMEAEGKRREFDAKWLLKDTALETITNLALEHKNATREAIEAATPRLFESGLSTLIPDDAQRQCVMEKLRVDCRSVFDAFQVAIKTRLTGEHGGNGDQREKTTSNIEHRTPNVE